MKRSLSYLLTCLLTDLHTAPTGLDAVEKKFGQGKVDPQKERGVNEKVTDKARGMFEKATGYDSFFPSLAFASVLVFAFGVWGFL